MWFNWTRDIAEKVRQHRDALLSQSGSLGEIQDGRRRNYVEVAVATNCLPVYTDMGGALLLDTDGTVRCYEWDTLRTTEITDDRQIVLAIVAAAQEYPDLIDLLPRRPPLATSCSDCSGTGKLFDGKIYCGTCHGLGWVAEPVR
jgi:hypothetical protein